ncbi:MAG: hypothetical protein R3E32_17390 [Chitinophagales bacterium]
MKQFLLIFMVVFCCEPFLLGQAKVALISDDATGTIIGSSIELKMVSLKVIGRDDCDAAMEFKGTVEINLGGNSGSLTYRFDAEPANDLIFGKNAYFTTMGYDYGEQVDVWFKILDTDKSGCGSLQDIVDVNELTTENALKIRIEGNKVWLLNSQNQEMKVLGNIGELITIRGNRYVNNSANTRSLRGRVSDNRDMTNQERGGKWNLPPDTENLGAPDIEVAEFQFFVQKESGNFGSHTPHPTSPLSTTITKE